MNLLTDASKLPHRSVLWDANNVKIATLTAQSTTGLGHAGTEDAIVFLVVELSYGQPHRLISSLYVEATDAASHLSPQQLRRILKALTYILRSTARNCLLRAAGPSGSNYSIQLRKPSLSGFDGWDVSYKNREILGKWER